MNIRRKKETFVKKEEDPLLKKNEIK